MINKKPATRSKSTKTDKVSRTKAPETTVKTEGKSPRSDKPKPLTSMSSVRGVAKPVVTAPTDSLKPVTRPMPPTAKSTSTARTTPNSKSGTPVKSKKAPEDLRMKELIELIIKRTDVQRKHVKKIVEAMDAELGEAVRKNREIVLKGLGRIKYQRTIQNKDALVSIVRIRQKDKTAGKKEPEKKG